MQSLLLTGVHKLLFGNFLQGLEAYKAFSRSQCDRQPMHEKSDSLTDVFSRLSQAFHHKTQKPLFTREELHSESSLLIIAGLYTTSTCLAATFFYLLHNPEALSRVQNEVRKAFHHLEDIRSGPGLSACHYLRACIHESLRLSPPVGGLMPREVLSGGMEVDGQYLPQGVEIETPHYALHHEEAHYREPFVYKPERWLADEGSDVTKAQSAFCAFSIGPRSCVEKLMAYQELMTVLGRVIWECDIRLGAEMPLAKGPRKGRVANSTQRSTSSLTLLRARAQGRWCSSDSEAMLSFKESFMGSDLSQIIS